MLWKDKRLKADKAILWRLAKSQNIPQLPCGLATTVRCWTRAFNKQKTEKLSPPPLRGKYNLKTMADLTRQRLRFFQTGKPTNVIHERDMP